MKKTLTLLIFIFLCHLSFSQVWKNLAPENADVNRAGAFSINGFGYIFGGGYQTGAYSYDTLTNMWTPVTSYPVNTTDGIVGCSLNGIGYAGTGAAGGYQFSNTFYKYDPNAGAGGTWTALPNFPGPVRTYCVAFALDGKVYIGGGLQSWGGPGGIISIPGGQSITPRNDFYTYNPATNKWDTIVNCPALGVSCDAVAFTIGDKAYVGSGGFIDGVGTSVPQNDFWEYDTISKMWSAVASLPGLPRAEASAFSTCDKGYVGLGYIDSTRHTDTNDFWQYDPVKNSWVQIANYGGSAKNGACAFGIGKTGYVCMGSSPSYTYFHDLWSYTAVFTPSFSANSTACTGGSVSFTDNSNYSPTNWYWQFAGGKPATSTMQNPTVEYDTTGTWNVTLTAWNGCDSATKAFSKYITVNPGAALTIVPASASVCSGTTVTLTVSRGNKITWNPGATLNKTTGDTVIANPLSTTTYTATDSTGSCVAKQQVVVTIVPSDTAGTATPVRDTICQNTKGTINLAGNNSNVLQWQSSPTNSNFVNINGADTTFYVTDPLSQSTCYRVMVGTGNCTAISDTVCLFVPPALTASFNFTVLGGNNVTFNADSSTGNIVTYSWTFGDGQISQQKNPSHSYPKIDTTYNACLTIYDGSNCSYTFCKDVPLFTGIATVAGQGDIQIFPNPVGNKLAVSSWQLAGSEIDIIDILGRTLLAQKAANNQATIDVSNLSAGIYLIQVRNKAGTVVKKFVKE